jgi:regulator of sigma E protease
VILVHELGHFWAAKLFGVYAPRFSIGFGPTLWAWRRGETEYVLAAIPLGGYVRMATRDDEATTAHGPTAQAIVARVEGGPDTAKGSKAVALDPTAMIPFGPNPVPPERWFESKPLWQRVIILLAGVSMNVVLAVVVLASIFGVLGRPHVRPIVEAVVDTMPAARAGLLAGDSIATVDGVAMTSWAGVVSVVSQAPGRPVRIGVVRSGATVEITVTPEPAVDTNLVTGEPVTVGRIGMQAPEAIRVRVNPAQAAVLGTQATWRMGVSVLQVLKGLVTGSIGVNQLGGPVAIARSSVQAAQSGLENLFVLIAFLSVNLAILNLVPIPLLDGGQILLQSAEAAKGSPFSDRAREWYARIGLAAIATLFIVVTFNDIKALVVGWIS